MPQRNNNGLLTFSNYLLRHVLYLAFDFSFNELMLNVVIQFLGHQMLSVYNFPYELVEVRNACI